MFATDRISAFDVVLPTGIPGKGAILTQLSAHWFDLTSGLIPNHVMSTSPADLPVEVAGNGLDLDQRMMLVRRAERIDVECVVRGYLAGSAWSEDRSTGSVAGERLAPGLLLGDRLPAPLFTPAAKNDDGHDVNISRGDLAGMVGEGLARRLEEISRDVYSVASDFARQRDLILADTK